MRLPLFWLREYINCQLSPDQLKEKLILSGTNVESVEKIDGEIVFDLEITPNRPDCLSIVGLAREVAALTGQKLKLPPIKKPKPSGLRHPLFVEVRDANLCPRYTAAVISGLKVTSSPKWIQKKLVASGLRPVNNIVDITNYVMLELSQPIHAFDYEKIEGKRIIVRRAKEGEKIRTLDGVERKLSRDILVIADSKKPIGIAGVMGNETTEVSKKTSIIVLESATFFGPNINNTGRLLGLRTDALDRFEKGLGVESAISGLERCINLILEICGGKLEEVFDIQNTPPKLSKIRFDWDLPERLLGIKIPKSEMVKILTSLGFKIKDSLVLPPPWRGDISIPEDLVEEIGRIYGYEQIPPTLPVEEFPLPQIHKGMIVENLTRAVFKAAGFYEVYNYSFISKDLIRKTELDETKALRIINPLTPEFEYLRTSLVPSVLQSTLKNLRNLENFKIFELSKVYLPRGKNQLPQERLRLTGALLVPNSFYQAKGMVELLADELNIKNINFQPAREDIYHPGRCAQILGGGKSIGFVGEIHPLILERFNIKRRVGLLDLDFEKIVKLANLAKKYKPIPKYPPVKMDLSFIVPERVLYRDILSVMRRAGGKLVAQIELFDVYRSRQIGKGKKSLSFSITYQARDRTLSDEEAKKVQEKIIKALKDRLQAVIRER